MNPQLPLSLLLAADRHTADRRAWLGAKRACGRTCPRQPISTVPGMPPVVDAKNLYSESVAGRFSPTVSGDLVRVYVPNLQSNEVYVIDPATFKVVDKFKVGVNPQHVVPSWDLKTLFVANNAEGRTDGSLTPVDPKTGKPGAPLPVDDPYNMYFSPDGKSAIIVAEALKRLDFRDPHTMKLQYSIATPRCAGINHADFSIDGRYAIFTCEFTGSVVKIDLVERKVLQYLQLIKPGLPTKTVKGFDGRDEVICTTWKGMPQDIRASPDGSLFFVADMMSNGVYVVDGATFRQIDFIPTGVGTHGLYPSRDGRKLYIANRGSNKIHGPPQGQGQRVGARFRDAQDRCDMAHPRWRQSRHGQRQRRRQSTCGSRGATTTLSTRSIRPTAK